MYANAIHCKKKGIISSMMILKQAKQNNSYGLPSSLIFVVVACPKSGIRKVSLEGAFVNMVPRQYIPNTSTRRMRTMSGAIMHKNK